MCQWEPGAPGAKGFSLECRGSSDVCQVCWTERTSLYETHGIFPAGAGCEREKSPPSLPVAYGSEPGRFLVTGLNPQTAKGPRL